MSNVDLDSKHSTLIDELSALNAKFSSFLNGPKTATVPTDNGPIKTLASIVSGLEKFRYVQKMIDHRLYADMINDSTNIEPGLLVRVWGDTQENIGVYQKNDIGQFMKINYQSFLDNDQSNTGNTSAGKLLYGNAPPDSSVGSDGDFYIDVSDTILYGPKIVTWPAGIMLNGQNDNQSSTDSSNIIKKLSSQTLSGHRVVYINSSNKVDYASNNAPTQGMRVLGITVSSSLVNELASVQIAGEIVEPTWNWDVTKYVYLGIGGYLTQTPPTSGFVLIVGVPSSATSMIVNIREPIILS